MNLWRVLMNDDELSFFIILMCMVFVERYVDNRV